MQRTGRSAFTLVELLVVVAIISILAAMLMPALTNAIESAMRAQCASNTRQLFTTHVYYADDWTYMPLRTGINSWNVKDSTHYGVFQVMEAAGYIEAPAVLQCPSTVAPNDGFYSNYFSPNASIEMMGGKWRDRGGEDWDRYLIRFYALEDSTTAPIVTDANYMDWVSTARLGASNHSGDDIFKPQGMNVAWFDGHTSWELYEDLSYQSATSGNYRMYWYPTNVPRLMRDPNSSKPTSFYFGTGTSAKRGKVEPAP